MRVRLVELKIAVTRFSVICLDLVVGELIDYYYRDRLQLFAIEFLTRTEFHVLNLRIHTH